MSYQYPSPFENFRSPSPSNSVSPMGTPRSLSSSPLSSPLESPATSGPPPPLPRYSMSDAVQTSYITPKPVTPSLLDSPLGRRVPNLPQLRSPSPIQNKFPQHSRYFFKDEMAVLLVEGCLFRVHRYHLDRESQVFPRSTGSHSNPIELSGVTQTEFESLLDFLYDGMHNETTPSLAAWASLLSIATRFEMKRIRSRAITEISTFRPRIDPVDQVVLAVKHDIPEWLPLAYAALCQRDDPLEVEEAKRLGIETTVLLAKARERVRKGSSTTPNHFSNPKENANLPIYPSFQPQQQRAPDPAPFVASLVDRVLKEIFWPAQVLPSKPTEASPIIPQTPLHGRLSDNSVAYSSGRGTREPSPNIPKAPLLECLDDRYSVAYSSNMDTRGPLPSIPGPEPRSPWSIPLPVDQSYNQTITSRWIPDADDAPNLNYEEKQVELPILKKGKKGKKGMK